MVKKVTYSPTFKRKFKKLDKNNSLRAKKLTKKIIKTPKIGKPMKHEKKGTREVYMSPFRLSYSYDVSEEHLIFLDIYHKDKQ